MSLSLSELPLHLLYARFWHKVLFDLGLVKDSEPFLKLVHQGLILGEDGQKMSKSRGNVVNPDDVVRKHGADALRLYEMFMGPLEQVKPWQTSGIEGVRRFLDRVWNACTGPIVDDSPATYDEATQRLVHKTLKKVGEDIEGLRFNTAISQFMIFVNHFTKAGRRPRRCMLPFVQLLAPFAPHLAAELWQQLGETSSLTYAKWPVFDPELAKDDVIIVAVQVLGKTRGSIEVEPGAEQARVEELARAVPAVHNQLTGKTVRKVIFVKDKIINFVVS